MLFLLDFVGTSLPPSHGLNIFVGLLSTRVLVILEKYPFVSNDEINDLKLLNKK